MRKLLSIAAAITLVAGSAMAQTSAPPAGATQPSDVSPPATGSGSRPMGPAENTPPSAITPSTPPSTSGNFERTGQSL